MLVMVPLDSDSDICCHSLFKFTRVVVYRAVSNVVQSFLLPLYLVEYLELVH
jgi:hypothetical protein